MAKKKKKDAAEPETSTATIHFEPPVHDLVRIPRRKAKVELRITVGRKGQSGRTEVHLGGSPLGNFPDSFTQALGTGRDVDGLLLHTHTLISDLDTSHNDVSWRIEILADGAVVYFQDRARSLPTHGDSVVYQAFLTFLTEV